MQDKLYVKIGIIALLSLMLLLPLSMIESQIAARSHRQTQVIQNIAESAAGAQTLVGPVLGIQYRERVVRRKPDQPGEFAELVDRTMIVPAQRLGLEGEIGTEIRSRGLYQARLFHLGATLDGSIDLAAHLGIEASRHVQDVRAFLVFGVADVRGITNDPEVVVNGRKHRFIPGTRNFFAGNGVHLPLGGIDIDKAQRFDFSFPLRLTGSERLAIAPTASATSVALKSNWPHPSFQGRFLPTKREISANGFDAHWQVSQAPVTAKPWTSASSARSTSISRPNAR
jgi:inner membrane protein